MVRWSRNYSTKQFSGVEAAARSFEPCGDKLLDGFPLKPFAHRYKPVSLLGWLWYIRNVSVSVSHTEPKQRLERELFLYGECRLVRSLCWNDGGAVPFVMSSLASTRVIRGAPVLSHPDAMSSHDDERHWMVRPSLRMT